MQPKIYTAKEHLLSPNQVDHDAMNVIRTLHEKGFKAYIVGGGVRDLLLGRKPKDFDIATSAHPNQVKKLFRRCFLVGRRFRLAHVLFGKKVIEVATFRAGVESSELVLRDNTWGTPEQDAERRDFTINGLFYDPDKNVITDFVGGYKDLKKSLIKVIGYPEHRFLQDPVRMIRLIKFQAKFDLHVDTETKEAAITCRKEILKSSPARILEEVFKILESGASASTIRLMSEYNMLNLIFPWLEKLLKSKVDYLYLLKTADNAINEGGTLTRATLLSCLLFPILQNEIKRKKNPPSLHDIHDITYRIIEGVSKHSFPTFPRKLQSQVAFSLNAQYRLTPVSKKPISQKAIARHPEFPNARKLLELRSISELK